MIRERTPIAVALAVAVLALAGLAAPFPPEHRVAAAAVILLGAAGVVLLAASARHLLHPATPALAAQLAIMIAVPLLQLSIGAFSAYHREAPERSFVTAAALNLLYVAGLVAGLAPVLRMGVPGVRAATPAQAAPPALRRLVLLLALAGGAAWILWFRLVGGLAFFIDNLQNKTQLASGLGYVSTAAHLLQVAALLAAAAHSAGRRLFRPAATWALLGIAVALELVAGARARAVMILLAAAAAHLGMGHRPRLRTAVAIAVLGASLVFLAGQLRSLGGGTGAILDWREVQQAVRSDGGGPTLERIVVDYGHFDRLSMVPEYVPEQLPYQWGRTLWAALSVPIPRQLYPDKPLGSGPLLANAFRPGAWDLESGWTSGVTATIVGELYLNFSWPGVPLGGFVMGLLAGWAYAWYLRRRGELVATVQYAVFLVFFVLAGTLGEFYGTLVAWAVYAVPLAAIGAVVRPRPDAWLREATT